MSVVERLAAFGTAAAASLPPSVVGRTIAVGWATVDLDRAIEELGGALGLPPGRFVVAPETRLLGGRCRVADAVLPDGSALAVLEPSTEGRLAATLARTGEGPAAIWLAAPGGQGPGAASTDPDTLLSAKRDGPFGPERLVLGGPIHGPHRLLVALPVTIKPMTDTPQLVLRLARAADAQAIAALFTDEGYPAGPSDIVARLERFDVPESRVVVAEHEDAILGFIAVHSMARFEHDDRIVRILALVVDAGARERGVGRALMAEAERFGREVGAAFVELTAGHHRPEARHLYESLGYDSTVTAYLRKKL